MLAFRLYNKRLQEELEVLNGHFVYLPSHNLLFYIITNILYQDMSLHYLIAQTAVAVSQSRQCHCYFVSGSIFLLIVV